MTPGPLLALLGQLDELCELIMDHLDESRILLHPLDQVIGILGVQLRAQVGIANLQTNRHSTVPLEDSTAIVALNLLGGGPFDRGENVLQP